MCQATTQQARRAVNATPRWGLLYARTLSQLAALGAVEAVHSPHVLRMTLRCVLALGVFATMSVWVRANRPALDLQNWCDCAGARMTIRVIESDPRTTARPLELEFISSERTEEDYELVGH